MDVYCQIKNLPTIVLFIEIFLIQGITDTQRNIAHLIIKLLVDLSIGFISWTELGNLVKIPNTWLPKKLGIPAIVLILRCCFQYRIYICIYEINEVYLFLILNMLPFQLHSWSYLKDNLRKNSIKKYKKYICTLDKVHFLQYNAKKYKMEETTSVLKKYTWKITNQKYRKLEWFIFFCIQGVPKDPTFSTTNSCTD